PGIVTATLSALFAALFFTSPGTNLAAPGNLFQLMLFLLEGLLVVGFTGNLRENRMKAEKDQRAKDEALALLDTFQVYAPVGLAFLDHELRYIRINYAMAELDGLTPAAHIGRTLQDVQPNMNPELFSAIQQVLETGKPLLDQELTIVKPTMLGMKKQHLLTSYYRIRGIEGEPLGVGAVMLDVTQYRQSEEAVRESEIRFRTMADTAPVMIWLADTNKLRTYFNKGWFDFTGRTPEQDYGNGWTENLHPDGVQPYLDVYTTAFDARQEFNTEYRLRRKDGEYRWLISHGVPRFTPEGEFAGYIGISVDITERKQAEEIVRESETRFRRMADTAPVMIWLADTNKLRTYFNKGWFDFTGRTEEQDYGNGWTENLHPDDVKPYLDVYTTAFDARQEFNTEYRLRRQDGEYRWLISHGVPRFTPEGQFAGYIGISVDITERKQLQIAQDFVLQTGVVMSSSLDYQTTIENVARLAVPTMADWCAVDILAPDSKSLERLAVAHVDPEKVKWAYELQRRYPVDLNAQSGTAEVIRSGKTQFTPEITEGMIEAAATDADMYQIIVDIGFTSVITAPLIARGRTIGVLTLVSAESKRHYTETDVATAEQLAVRIALAVDSAHLFREAQAERERFRVTLASIGDAVIATDHQGRVTFINEVASNLTEWPSSEALGTSLDSIFKIVNEQTRQTVESPVDKVLREGRVVGLANHTVLISKSGGETPIDDSGAPIPGENGEIGGVVLVFRDVSERKREEQRQQYLVEASQLLSSSLEYETTLSTVVKLAVPTIADWCAVDLLTPQGAIQRVTVAHIDPDKVEWAYEVQKRFPPTLDATNGVGHVLRTGETEFVPDVPALLAPIYDMLSADMKQVMDKLQSVSVITTPLKARDITIGALTFATAESGRRYNEYDVQFAETLAGRVALAVDNSRLYSEAQSERERFRVTLASIGDAVIATNSEGEVTFLNQIASNLTGWSQEEAIGTPLSSIFNI
ncbi:MAG: PAS domain S-box protein, partial [Chloroflexota bacterium]